MWESGRDWQVMIENTERIKGRKGKEEGSQTSDDKVKRGAIDFSFVGKQRSSQFWEN